MDQHPDGPSEARAARRQPSHQDLARRTEFRRALDRREEPEGAPPAPEAGETRDEGHDGADVVGWGDVPVGYSDYLHRDDRDELNESDERDGRRGSAARGGDLTGRPGAQYPRTVKYAGLVAVAVVAGWAAFGMIGGGGGGGGKPDAAVPGPGPITTAGDGDGATSTPEATATGDAPPASASGSASSQSTPSPSKSSKSSSPSASRSPSPSVSRSGPATPTSPAFTALRLGSSGPAVSTMQHRLDQDGYVLDMLGYSNGTYDRATYDGVVAFQDDHPGTAQADGVGVYGPATDAALRSEVR